jgi:EAL domain-containing protein (putative c-di-GMP-specific phosphodiesterase class I)
LIWFVDNVTTKWLNPKKIWIEVLESVDMTDEYVIEALEFLREKWFTILVDDFWEEKANMKHVIAISPDVIKLDRKTMETIFATRIWEIKWWLDSEIIEVLEYTKENWCTIITEWIENNEQLITMQELAKEYAVKMLFQWYFLWRPVNPRELFKQKIPSPESIRLENIVTTNQYVA